jgi:hypothetical protein
MDRPKQLLATARAQLDSWRDDLREAREMPVVTINLMYRRTADNHVFFRELTQGWYDEVTGPHPRFRVIPRLEWGVAVCHLPRTLDDYFMFVESSARRNAKKAQRSGYRCQPFTLTEDYVPDVRAIHQSTDVRQGKVTDEILHGPVNAVTDPPSRTPFHAYPDCGVFFDERLVAYSSCFVAGEMASVERIFGHADHQAAGVVPMMLMGMSKLIYENHPAVRYLVYGSYFGSAPNMRRFKKKFRFYPHRVHWKLDTRETAE